MKKYIKTIKFSVIASLLLSAISCVSDDLPGVGDLSDSSGPSPFYNFTDVTTSEFDCEDVELWAKYEFTFTAGSNLAVNGTQYQWQISDADGNVLSDLSLVNPQYYVYNLLIDAQKPDVVALEEDIAELEKEIPCEENAEKVVVLEAELVELNLALETATTALAADNTATTTIASLEAERDALSAATLQDQELIIEFPEPGTYSIALTVTDNLGKSETTESLLTVVQAVPTIAIPEIGEAGFEDLSLFDGTGDGRDSWRAPSNDDWSPVGGGTTIFQINTKSEGVLPEGTQAAKFPSSGERIAYQEIEVTPGASYTITYFTAFNLDADGDFTVSILKPETLTYTDAQLEANILATRTDSNTGRTVDVFKQHALSFDAGENETVIILGSNSGDEARLDQVAISVK